MSILVLQPVRRLAPRPVAIRWWGRAVQAWRCRQADHALQGMSDAMLHDIGVARSEISELTRHGRAGRD